MCRKLCHFIWGIWWFHRSKDFEAMKAGKSAIRPWLSCQYNENTLVDLPSSVGLPLRFPNKILNFGSMCTYKEELCLSDLPLAAPLPSVARMPLLALVFSWFSPDLSWAILHHPLNVCKDHSWFYYRGILSLLHARTWHFQKSLYRCQRYSLPRVASEYRAYPKECSKVVTE